jgi:chemotaxis protein methyltransferase CheR
MTDPACKLSDAEFRLISETVYKHCGITLNENKRDMVQARLAKQLRDGGHASVSEYLKQVMSDASGDEFTDLIDAISTNLTSFFREADHFQYIKETLVPAMVKRSRTDQNRRLLAWCAACSSGEEPYSLGITLCQSLVSASRLPGRPMPAVDSQGGPAGWDIRILATDISTRMLRTAAAAQYPEARLTGVPPDCREVYFQADPQAPHRPERRHDPERIHLHEVRPFLRRMIRFRHLNLMDPWPFKGPFDLIFCRNVMIYFDQATQERLVSRFGQCLRPGGLLFTGHSESLSGINHRLKQVKPSIYAKPQGGVIAALASMEGRE